MLKYGYLKLISVFVVNFFLVLHVAADPTNQDGAADDKDGQANSRPDNSESQGVGRANLTPGEAIERFTTVVKKDPNARSIGRGKNIREAIRILKQDDKNNVIILGEAGSGKTNLTTGVRNALPDNWLVLSVDVNSIEAGTRMRGDFEENFQALMKGAQELADQGHMVVLDIDEFHRVMAINNVSGSDGANTMADQLKLPLEHPKIRFFAKTTSDEYHRHVQSNRPIDRRFEQLYLDELTKEQVLTILRWKKQVAYEEKGVPVMDSALEFLVDKIGRFVHNEASPDPEIKAFHAAVASLIDDRELGSADIVLLEEDLLALQARMGSIQADLDFMLPQERASAKIQLNELEAQIQQRTKDLKALKESDHKNHEIIELKRRIQGARERALHAMLANDSTEAGRITTEEIRALEKQLQEERQRAQESGQPSIEVVDSIRMADTIATLVPNLRREDIMRNEVDRLNTLRADLEHDVVGHNTVKDEFHSSLEVWLANMVRAEGGGFKILLDGPSGNGKTTFGWVSAKAMGRVPSYFAGSDYKGENAIEKAKGWSETYRGGGGGGDFINAARQNPFGLFIIDEIDQASPAFIQMLYDIFENGGTYDNNNKRRWVDFSNIGFIITTNASGHYLAMEKGSPEAIEYEKKVLGEDVWATLSPDQRVSRVTARLQEIAGLTLALQGRVTRLSAYALSVEEAIEVTRITLRKQVVEYAKEQHGIYVEFSDALVKWVARLGYDKLYGARSLKETLKPVYRLLSKAKLSGLVHSGDTISVSFYQEGPSKGQLYVTSQGQKIGSQEVDLPTEPATTNGAKTPAVSDLVRAAQEGTQGLIQTHNGCESMLGD